MEVFDDVRNAEGMAGSTGTRQRISQLVWTHLRLEFLV